jgi:hypothetical protein
MEHIPWTRSSLEKAVESWGQRVRSTYSVVMGRYPFLCIFSVLRTVTGQYGENCYGDPMRE